MRLPLILTLVALLPALAAAGGRTAGPAVEKARLIVLTDISSLTAGVREPDDGQSLIRLLLYANDIDLEGLVASSNLGHGQVTRPELIREAIAAYGRVRQNLLLHSNSYPTAEKLLEGVKAGQPVAERKTPVLDSIGEGKDTEASEWIQRVVDRPDRRPVWVSIWGGSADLAQALWKVRKTRSAEAAAAFVAKLRVSAVGDQDSTGPWLREQFPDLYYVTRGFAIRGMYRGGEIALSSREWVDTHIRNDHGALGALYPNYNGGDIWSHRLGQVRGIKEGDTPSYLSLIPNGLGDSAHPEWGGWGGRLTVEPGKPMRLGDAADEPGPPTDPDPAMAAVYRWRPAYQADFQARLDWCVKPFAAANHAPVLQVKGEARRRAKPGRTVTLDARASTDPDGNTLSFEWFLDRGTGGFAGPLSVEDAHSPVAGVKVPELPAGSVVHVLLAVRDNGSPPLTAYRRILIEVEA